MSATATTTTVNITINGKALQAQSGQTVMEAASAAGIDIPALCNDPHLRPEGGCRMCVVEIDKQRGLQPACTFPIFEGMVVRTETEKTTASRKQTLQMLFSERNHYCMFCPASGSEQTTDCELQRLGYRYGLTHWQYTPKYANDWAVDATRPYFVMDHSRCILCRRCVRACNTIAANHTLGLAQRGAQSRICADDDVQFGASTCVSCGTCLQVCPTGALADRRGAYMAHETELTRTSAVCMGCAVGCGIEALTRDNQLIRVEGSWKTTNGGLLCATGRFDVVEPKPQRILTPLVRQDGRMVEITAEKAMTHIAQRLRQLNSVAGLASPRLTNETLAAFQCFCHEVLETNEVGLLYGEVPPLDLGKPAVLQDLVTADCIVVIGGDPLERQKVLGFLIKRGSDNGAKVIVVNDRGTGLDRYAHTRLDLQDISHAAESPFERLRRTYHLRVSGVTQLKAACEAAQRPIVLYSTRMSTTVYAALRALQPKVKFLPLVEGTNAAGAAKLGMTARPVSGQGLYLLAGDDLPDGTPLPAHQFMVVQAAYRSAWTEAADVVLPSLTWPERKGHVVNLEERNIPVVPVLTPPKGLQADWETLLALSVRMGYTLSYQEITEISMTV